MRISVVSPSFNQISFIDRTIKSISDQNYSDKQHIIVDGNSTDGSAEVIRRSARELSHVEAIIESDNGQSDAINKGFKRSDGEILAWLNTDDFYFDSEVFGKVVRAFLENPSVDIVYGRGLRLDKDGRKIREAWINKDIKTSFDFWKSLGVLQPSLFFRRHVFEKIGGLKDEYSLQLDYDYWIRMAAHGFKFKYIDEILSCAVVHEDAKSTRDRLAQLSECIDMIQSHFGEVPNEWFDRFGDFLVSEIDQKTDVRKNERAESTVIASSNASLFVKTAYNGISTALLPRERFIITAFDSKYFNQGLNLIASLHRSSLLSFDQIYVYSIGLSQAEEGLLASLQKVKVVHLPHPPYDFPEFNEPRARAYKTAAIATENLFIKEGASVLWVDAGISVVADIESIFSKIEENEFFITNHDDSRHWPIYNMQFMHPEAVSEIDTSSKELLSEHLCSAIVGYIKGGKYQNLIDEARRYGRRRAAILWPKVIEDSDRLRGPRIRKEAIEGLRVKALRDGFTPKEIKDSFPYYGHRTQCIFSVLVVRFDAPVFSSSIYRQGNEKSSIASRRNWVEGADHNKSSEKLRYMDEIKNHTICFHHRGTYSNLAGLSYKRSHEPVFIVGNGPSLSGFDFKSLESRVWVGMNAAYRYWDEIGIYPFIYCCLDLVVQESHQEEIKRLIENKDLFGIEYFFLRKSFVKFWPEIVHVSGIYFLEDLKDHVEWFDRDKVTTGSFSAYFCAFLGFKDIYLLGIDLNYVEVLDEATAEGRELVITRSVERNPNYFFDGYQKPGDRYNPPNRHSGMHLRSWEECAKVLPEWGVEIRNCNPDSSLKAFPFETSSSVLNRLSRPFNTSLIFGQFYSMALTRQVNFRNMMLLEIDAPVERFEPTRLQVIRFGNWFRSEINDREPKFPVELTVNKTGIENFSEVSTALDARNLLLDVSGKIILGSKLDELDIENIIEDTRKVLGSEDIVLCHFQCLLKFYRERR